MVSFFLKLLGNFLLMHKRHPKVLEFIYTMFGTMLFITFLMRFPFLVQKVPMMKYLPPVPKSPDSFMYIFIISQNDNMRIFTLLSLK